MTRDFPMQFASLDRGRPVGDQIVGQFIAQVEAEGVREGTRLPSVRALADALEVNRNTIAQVYKELAQKGYVVSRFGAGSYVCKPNAERYVKAGRPIATERGSALGRPGTAGRPRAGRLTHEGLPAALGGTGADGRGAALEPGGNGGAASPGPEGTAPERWSAREWEQRFSAALAGFPAQVPVNGSGAINLASLQPYTGLFPIEDFRLCLNTVLRRQGRHLLGYAAPAGYLPLRERIAARLKAQGMAVGAGQVLVTSGSQQGIDLLARGFLDPGDSVVVESPTYSIALKILQAYQARLVPYPVTREGVRLDGLERALARAAPKLFYAVPNFQNPTTHSYSDAEKGELLGWVYRSGGLLVEDASDVELHEDPQPTAIAALDRAERVLHLNTFSKTMAPAVRVGYLAGPATVIRKLTELKEMTDLSHSLILQAATAEFMERGLFDSHIAAVRAYYQKRMALVAGLLERELPDETPFTRPGGGVCVWVDLPPQVDAEAVHRDLAAHGVLVSPGGLYQPAPGGRNGLRLSVAQEPPERLSQGLRTLGQVLKRTVRRPAARPVVTEYQSSH